MEKGEKREHRLTTEDVGRICDAPEFVDHYRASLARMGLWKSEEILIGSFFEPENRILDLGCGVGRVSFGLWDLGFRDVEGLDLSPGMIAVAQEHSLATRRKVKFVVGDATALPYPDDSFNGVVFGFGGLMQIPGRARRKVAIGEVWRVLRPGGTFIFTTHDREMEEYRDFWKKEAWRPLVEGMEFGDIYEEGPHGMVFVHVPAKDEVDEDLRTVSWSGLQTFLRAEIAEEEAAVEELSDPCRFWLTRKPDEV